MAQNFELDNKNLVTEDQEKEKYAFADVGTIETRPILAQRKLNNEEVAYEDTSPNFSTSRGCDRCLKVVLIVLGMMIILLLLLVLAGVILLLYNQYTTTNDNSNDNTNSTNTNCPGMLVSNQNLQLQAIELERIKELVANLSTEHQSQTISSRNQSTFILSQLESHITQLTAVESSTATGAVFCDRILEDPNMQSGYYSIVNSLGLPVNVYCARQPIPNRNEPSMIRVGFLNMTDPNEQCPTGFRLDTGNSRRTCGRENNRINFCNSVTLATNNARYQRVCGRVQAYRGGGGGTDGFSRFDASQAMINAAYVDGVSLTYGSNPRNHIWSFAAGDSLQAGTQFRCPCTSPESTMVIPSFVGNDYFCVAAQFNNPLWDGEECTEAGSTCCSFNSPPWFCKDLPQSTTQDIELRICGDENTGDEDTPIEQFEIYIR